MNEEFVKNDEYEILSPDGWSDFSGIKKSSKECFSVVFLNGDTIECTWEHRLFINDKWVDLSDLDADKQYYRVRSITSIGVIDVYDPINVIKDNRYLSNNLISHNCLVLDEFAFVQTNLAEEFFTSVYPTLSSGKDSKLIIVSTPNGMNHFYKMWQEAVDGINGFDYVSADWSAVPWRDEKWADEQRRVLGEQKFSQEMETAFLGASNTLIAGSKLKCIPISQPVFSNNITAVYEKAQPGRRYCMTVDTSRGTGGDYSAFVVIDVTELPYQVVFRYRNNSISSMVYPSMIHKMALEYNNCPILVESNDVGESVAAALYFDLEYEETVFSRAGEICGWSGGQSSSPGLRTTTKTKRIGCDILKQLVEADKLVINDYDILNELSNFVVKGKSYEADVGHDDLVMCLVMFAYLTTTPKFEEISDQSVRERIVSERKLLEEAEMMPVGYYSDGTDQSADTFVF